MPKIVAHTPKGENKMKPGTIELTSLAQENINIETGVHIGSDRIEDLSPDQFEVGTKFIVAQKKRWVGADNEVKCSVLLLTYSDEEKEDYITVSVNEKGIYKES